MTAWTTDQTDHSPNGHTDQGAPVSAGSVAGAPTPRRRRTGQRWPEPLDNPFVRAAVAAQLSIRVEQLGAEDVHGAERAANDALADLLADVSAALGEG